MTKRWLLAIAALALISTRASANDLPIQIPYTGFLQQSGTAFSGAIPIQVTLTATDSSGVKTTWTESHPTVPVNGGRFNILLGSITPITPGFINTALASGLPLTLSVQVNGVLLNGTQTIYASAFANATTGAKSSPSGFTANGAVTINDPADATSSLLTTVIDALQVTGVGVPGSRLIRLFDNVNVAGMLTAGVGISTPTLHVTTFDTCPSDYTTTVSLPHSTLCVKVVATGGTNRYVDALDTCNSFEGGRLCTYQQLRRYCLVSTEPTKLTGNSWFGDRAGDSGAVYTNSGNCDDFDGAASTNTTGMPTAYCCLEWMKYY
jgi:hypothetical protein